MMTERQAWLYLAAMWDKAERGDPYRVLVENGRGLFGLCPCIEWLENVGSISPTTAKRIRAKIPIKRPYGFVYAWKPNATGAVKRAAFCRKQAALLAKKKAKKRA